MQFLPSPDSFGKSKKFPECGRTEPDDGCKTPGPTNGHVAVAKLKRLTFVTSRQIELLNERELVAQTGHSRDEWLVMGIREFFDNALDACEEANDAPRLVVHVDDTRFFVADNGREIPEDAIRHILNLNARYSSREAYVSPSRGIQGNALMTCATIPYILDQENGRFIIVTHGMRHSIACVVDQIRQQATFEVDRTPVVESDEPECVHKSAFGIRWTPGLWPFPTKGRAADEILAGALAQFGGRLAIEPASQAPDPAQVISLLHGYLLFNPHLSLTFNWFGESTSWEATDPNWRKWRPNQPTSPHWYDFARFQRLVAAYIDHDAGTGTARTVADFVGEFDGLSRKRQAVIDAVGLQRMQLSELANGKQLRTEIVERLLLAMQAHTKPVTPHRLGQIGEKHFRQRLEEFGCKPESITYKTRKRVDDGMAFVLESAFGYLGEGQRQIYAGANWSAAIKNPFRAFGTTGEGLEAQLAQLRVGREEPVVIAVHLAHPRIAYTDRGKSSLVIDE